MSRRKVDSWVMVRLAGKVAALFGWITGSMRTRVDKRRGWMSDRFTLKGLVRFEAVVN